MYVALGEYFKMNKIVELVVVVLLTICYLVEISRSVSIENNKIILSKAFSKKVELFGTSVRGMYVYSYNKNFLKKNALTTKLVITTNNNKTYKFVLGGLNYKSVLNMMKDCFGITEYKLYISKK